MGKDAGEAEQFEQGGLATAVGSGQQGHGLLVAFVGRSTDTVGHGVRFDAEQRVPPFDDHQAMFDHRGAHAAVRLGPA